MQRKIAISIDSLDRKRKLGMSPVHVVIGDVGATSHQSFTVEPYHIHTLAEALLRAAAHAERRYMREGAAFHERLVLDEWQD